MLAIILLLKDITQEQLDGRGAQGEVWRKGAEFPCPLQADTLPAPAHVHQPRGSLNPVFLEVCGAFIM